MPRPKGAEASSPKRRSRTGCRGCKLRKVKCGEEKPQCTNCVKQGDLCDYSVQLRWGGRSKKDQDAFAARGQLTSTAPWSSFEVASPAPTPTPRPLTTSATITAPLNQRKRARSPPSNDPSFILDPQLSARLPSAKAESTPAWHHENRHYSASSVPETAHAHLRETCIDSQTPYQMRSLSYTMPAPDFNWSEQHRPKRGKLTPNQNTRPNLPPLSETMAGCTSQSDQAISFTSTVPPSPMRRLSVSSLLSGPPDNWDASRSPGTTNLDPKSDGEGSAIYGYDLGFPDLDVSRNNDSAAIIFQSPASAGDVESRSATAALARCLPRPSKDSAFQRGGYYAQPVAIKIPLAFGTLPSYLTDSPMNLLYFHHFLNHTARVLTPHDCPDNPLRTILPKSRLIHALQGAHLLTSIHSGIA